MNAFSLEYETKSPKKEIIVLFLTTRLNTKITGDFLRARIIISKEDMFGQRMCRDRIFYTIVA